MAYSNYRSEWNRDRNERWRSGGQRDESRDRDDDDSRRARESMERDYYGSEMGGRGGYGGRGYQDRGSREGQSYNRGYGQGDYDQNYGQREFGQGGRSSASGYGRGREYLSDEARRHHGNQMGGWEGREEEQWRNRDVHGQYDRDANYGGFSSSGTGNYAGYGGSGGSYQGGGRGYQGGRGNWGQTGMQYSQTGYGYPEQGSYGQGGDYGSRGYERVRRGFGGPGQSDYRAGQGGYGEAGSGRPSGGRAYGDYSGSPSGYYGEDYGRQGRGQSGWQGSQGHEQWGQGQEYGQYRGRGPKGYKRSDDRIRDEVCDCLTDDDRLDASNIDIAVKDGEVTLSGFVIVREDKRWAELLAERISGVREVQNSLRVQDQQRTQSGSTGTPGTGTQGTSASGAATGTSTTGSASGKDKGKDLQH